VAGAEVRDGAGGEHQYRAHNAGNDVVKHGASVGHDSARGLLIREQFVRMRPLLCRLLFHFWGMKQSGSRQLSTPGVHEVDSELLEIHYIPRDDSAIVGYRRSNVEAM
jgi:hypothetical protein